MLNAAVNLVGMLLKTCQALYQEEAGQVLVHGLMISTDVDMVFLPNDCNV